jgi:hypothetical protein
VFQLCLGVVNAQGIKAANLSASFKHEHVVLLDELGRDCEFLLPEFEPMFWITPIALRLEGDLCKR